MTDTDADTTSTEQPASEILIGTFMLGYENVRLFALPEQRGGSFTVSPEDNGTATIKIGMDHDESDVLAVLLHESFEMLSVRLGVRFMPSERGDQSMRDHACYLFSFDHCKFSEICEKHSWFVFSAWPALNKVFHEQLALKASPSPAEPLPPCRS